MTGRAVRERGERRRARRRRSRRAASPRACRRATRPSRARSRASGVSAPASVQPRQSRIAAVGQLACRRREVVLRQGGDERRGGCRQALAHCGDSYHVVECNGPGPAGGRFADDRAGGGSVDEPTNAPTNWGRWGPDDERGTANLLTPETVLAACAAPRSGRVYNLGIELQARRALRGPAHEPGAPHVLRRRRLRGARARRLGHGRRLPLPRDSAARRTSTRSRTSGRAARSTTASTSARCARPAPAAAGSRRPAASSPARSLST